MLLKKLIKQIECLLLLFFLLFSGCCAAQVVDDLNQACVVVMDRSDKALQQGFLDAYQQVLIKQSGNAAIMTIPEVQNSLPNLTNNVVRYRYLDSDNKHCLQVSFDQAVLRGVLADAGQAVLGNNRPLTLMVLLRSSVVLDLDAQLTQTINETAARYGLTILLPTMDLQDQLGLGEIKHHQLTLGQLRYLGQRYQVSSILYGDVEEQANGYRVVWRWWQPDYSQQWLVTGDSMAVVLQQAGEALLEHLADRYALLASSKMQGELLLRVHNVVSLRDYAQTVASLSHFSVVRNVSVKQVFPDTVLFNVRITGEDSVLQHALQTSSHFRFDDIDDVSGEFFVTWLGE